eukprot:gb/GECH01012614.1/.p1 GENE.gb/GECH01012614.1/~~gb/GECH01012614.1/.p1  ORF type:complete len:211 (+),score=24.26 gb/GECH01012614.1/:1-633(+)
MLSRPARRLRVLLSHVQPHLHRQPSNRADHTGNLPQAYGTPTPHPSHRYPAHSESAFRTLHTGIVEEGEGAAIERQRPVRLDLRQAYFDRNPDVMFPYTTVLILRHVLHVGQQLRVLNIHLKYVMESGDTYIMFRTRHGLVSYCTVQNRHWIHYLLVHATANEEPFDDTHGAGEGEYRLEVVSDEDGRQEYSCNVVYIQGGVKLTLAPIS